MYMLLFNKFCFELWLKNPSNFVKSRFENPNYTSLKTQELIKLNQKKIKINISNYFFLFFFSGI